MIHWFFDLKAQQSPSNLRFGNGKRDIKGNPVLNSHMDDFSVLLGETSIRDDFKSARGRKSDAFWWKKLNWEPAQVRVGSWRSRRPTGRAVQHPGLFDSSKVTFLPAQES